MFNKFKKQFIDVIDWTEEGDEVLSYRYPMEDMEIQNGGQLTVRESQMAVFVNEGNLADIFSPGRYTLTTKTLPVLTSLLNWDKLFKSPFKSDVYFFSTREKTDQRWGTQQPITVRDKEYGPIRIRAFGTFSYKIEEPATFHQKLSGTKERYSVGDLDGQLRSLIVTNIASKFGGGDVAFLDMAANQVKMGEELKTVLEPEFWNYGLKLCSFYVQSVTLPEELQEYLDKQSSMNLVGDVNKYAQFQAADSIKDAAQNPGGLAGAGVGLGAGAALGKAMTDAMSGGSNSGGNQGGSQAEEDPFQLLEKLQALLDKGIINQEEFDTKKADILKRIS